LFVVHLVEAGYHSHFRDSSSSFPRRLIDIPSLYECSIIDALIKSKYIIQGGEIDMWFLNGFLVLAFLVGVAVFMKNKASLKEERQKAQRRKADAIINERSYTSKRKINRLIASIEPSNKATKTTIPEEDRVRIDKLHEIRDSRDKY